MRKLALFLFGLLVANTVFAQSNNNAHYYVGIGYGSARTDYPVYTQEAVERNSSAVTPIVMGYRFSRELSMEVTAGSMGEVSAPRGEKFSADVISLSGVAFKQLSPDKLSVYGKLGLARAKTPNSLALDALGVLRTDLAFGAGFSLRASEYVSLRLGWDSYTASSRKMSNPSISNNSRSNVYGVAVLIHF